MKGEFYDYIPGIGVAVTLVVRRQESIHKLVNCSKCCLELYGDYVD